MKNKFFTVTTALMLLCVLLLTLVFTFTACETGINESVNDFSQEESAPEQESSADDTDESFVPGESSTPENSKAEQSTEPEVSVKPETYIWYGQAELDEWFEQYRLTIVNDSDVKLMNDGKHHWGYSTIDGLLITYINEKSGSSLFEEYSKLFEHTTDINTSALCEYYGITKEEYIAYYNVFLEEFGKEQEGVVPAYVMSRLSSFRYDTIFSEEYWNHPDYLLSDYVTPEIDDYYTCLDDRNGYTRRYYIIDRRLIEYVGVDEFNAWLESVDDAQQNIVEFIDQFGITREIYDDIFFETCYLGPPIYAKTEWRNLPYNPDYLFGTPEIQEEYFTVHPLELD